jgi:hypothetical protein
MTIDKSPGFHITRLVMIAEPPIQHHPVDGNGRITGFHITRLMAINNSPVSRHQIDGNQ